MLAVLFVVVMMLVTELGVQVEAGGGAGRSRKSVVGNFHYRTSSPPEQPFVDQWKLAVEQLTDGFPLNTLYFPTGRLPTLVDPGDTRVVLLNVSNSSVSGLKALTINVLNKRTNQIYNIDFLRFVQGEKYSGRFYSKKDLLEWVSAKRSLMVKMMKPDGGSCEVTLNAPEA
eukprot:Lankesteria_metandrocarpae@DN647_c0_g1_i1.p1